MSKNYCCFQYACVPMFKLATCEGCEEEIPAGSLRARFDDGSHWYKKWYHFDCFWKHNTTTSSTKDEIMVVISKISNENGKLQEIDRQCKVIREIPYVSLEVLDQYWPDVESDQKPEDIKRIREHVALDQEGKTPYYIPTVVVKDDRICRQCFNFKSKTERICSRCGDRELDHDWFGIEYNGHNYESHELSEIGILNIDAKDVLGYDTLDENGRKVWDELFKKKDTPVFFATCNELSNHDVCSLKGCKRGFGYEAPRIQCKHLTYHPKCFAATGKINSNGKDIPGYDKLNEENKMIFDRLFTESEDFDILLVEKAKKEDYCSAAECSISKFPSKFPYLYSIKKDEIQIRFQGNIYHPKCFKTSGKCDTVTKDMKNYENLTDEEKQNLDGIFKKVEKRKLETDQSNDTIKENEEPSIKKKKLSDDEEGATGKDAIEIE